MYGVLLIIVLLVIIKIVTNMQYRKLEKEVLKELDFSGWNIISYFDEFVNVKSRQTLDKYDKTKFFKENRHELSQVEQIIEMKNCVASTLRKFLENNEYKSRPQYKRLVKQISNVLKNAEAYRIKPKLFTEQYLN